MHILCSVCMDLWMPWQRHGLDAGDDRIFYGDYWYDGGNDMVRELMERRQKLPEAIACANDLMAVGVAEALADRGIRVPEDIAIVGYDSVPEGKESPSPITSMDIPSREFGQYAAECIRSLLDGQESPSLLMNHRYLSVEAVAATVRV